MKSRNFTEPVQSYTVLVLHLSEYRASERTLPEGFTDAGYEEHSLLRAGEKRLLRDTFDDWRIPFEGRLPGWREDSPIFIRHGDTLAGGVYLCDRNEFDRKSGWGQLHYAFMAPQFTGLGLYSILFREAVERARAWDLTALYLNSDRYLLPEVYIRWGARPWKVIEKKSRLPIVPANRVLTGIVRPLRRLQRRLGRILES